MESPTQSAQTLVSFRAYFRHRPAAAADTLANPGLGHHDLLGLLTAATEAVELVSARIPNWEPLRQDAFQLRLNWYQLQLPPDPDTLVGEGAQVR